MRKTTITKRSMSEAVDRSEFELARPTRNNHDTTHSHIGHIGKLGDEGAFLQLAGAAGVDLVPNHRLLGDEKNNQMNLPSNLAKMGFGGLTPVPRCSEIPLFLHKGERVHWKNAGSNWYNATVVKAGDKDWAVEVDAFDIGPISAGEVRPFRHVAPHRVHVRPDLHYKLFLSVVAGAFADDGDDASFYPGDYFTNPQHSDVLRCYYVQLLRDAATVTERSAFSHLKQGLLDVAAELENSLLTLPPQSSEHGPSGAVIQEMEALRARVQNLLEGDVIFFPCGWHGHAVYCEVQRETLNHNSEESGKVFTLSVFNSGDGVGHHYSISHDGFSRKYSPALIFSHLPAEELLNPTQLRAIIEPSALSRTPGGGSIPSEPESLYHTALGRLDARLDEDRSTRVMMDSQEGGTCMVTGLHHFVHFKLLEHVPAASQEIVGGIIEHALQRAALEWFVKEAKEWPVTSYLLPLEPFSHSVQSEYLPLPNASFYQLARQKQLLRTAARQAMMHNETDVSTRKAALNLSAWLDSHTIPRPHSLHDTYNESAVQISGNHRVLEVDYLELFARSEPESLLPSMRLCKFPPALLPENSNATQVLTALARATVDVMDTCFGENYIDWLANRVLELHLSEVAIDDRYLLSNVFFQLADQVRRLSATQPFADHLLALQRLVRKFHELAGVHDEQRLRRHNLPSLRQFAVSPVFEANPVESPQNLLFAKHFVADVTEDIGEEYTYMTLSRVEQESYNAPLAQICTASVHLNSEQPEYHFDMFERDQAGTPIKALKEWQKVNNTWKFKSAERYVMDFMRQAAANEATDQADFHESAPIRIQGLQAVPELNGKRGRVVSLNRKTSRWNVEIEGVGTKAVKQSNLVLAQSQLALEHVNASDPCSLCRYADRCLSDPARAAVCILSGHMGITTPVGISPDFFIMRKMLAEYHLLDNAVAHRQHGFAHIFEQPQEKLPDSEKKTHIVSYRWCDGPDTILKMGKEIAERGASLMETRPARHPTLGRLRAPLAESDEHAVRFFLFREPRPVKWERDKGTGRTSFKPLHDGDNAVVLYDLANYGTHNELTRFQRVLFEVGLHPSLTRAQWLGHLQEHPQCFLDVACRVSTDAILFSKRFNPNSCTDSPETPAVYFEQVLLTLKMHEVALTGEPDEKLLLASSHVRLTRHRLNAKLDRASKSAEMALIALHDAKDGWLAERELKHKRSGRNSPRKSLATLHGKAEWLERLKYTLTCLEFLVVVDLHGSQSFGSLTSSRDAKECVALFWYVARHALDELDPAALHQASRVHGSLVRRSEKPMCKLIGGEFHESAFPLLRCGGGRINMLSGVWTEHETNKIEHHNLPLAVREQAIAHAVTRLEAKSAGQVNHETLKIVTIEDISYFFTQQSSDGIGSERNMNGARPWQAEVFVHRRADQETLQLFEPCVVVREFKIDPLDKPVLTKIDLRLLLVGSMGSSDHFCWTSADKELVQITHIDATGSDEVVLVLYLNHSSGMEILVQRETANLPSHIRGQRLHWNFADRWLDPGLWKKGIGNGILFAAPELAMDGAGIFTRFHEGRPHMRFHGSIGGAVVFPGVARVNGGALALEEEIHSDMMKRRYVYHYDKQVTYHVVDARQYKKNELHLLEHGVPHLLLARKVSVRHKRSVLLAIPLPASSSNAEAEIWGTPIRQALVMDLRSDGFLAPRKRKHQLAITLLMMQVKNFDHAFKYLSSVRHLTPWNKDELFFLHRIAGASGAQRDADTSYLRLAAVKLIRDDCLRFAVAGCEKRTGIDDEEWMSTAQKSMELALQTKHLVPIYRIVEMRTFTLTRFFATNDLNADPNGLRGWLLGGVIPEQDLKPKRQKYPVKKDFNSMSDIFQFVDRSSKDKANQWQSVFPSGFLQNLDDVKEYFQLLEGKIFGRSAQVLLFLWLQPVGPAACEKLTIKAYGPKQLSYQIALLLHIYNKSRSESASWQMDMLKPLVEAWLFAKDVHKCNNCAVMHGLMQLLFVTEPSEKINVFEAILGNLHFKGGEPRKCCSNLDAREIRAMERRNQEWINNVPNGQPRKTSRTYGFVGQPKVAPFGLQGNYTAPDAEEPGVCHSNGLVDSQAAKEELLNIAYKKRLLESDIHLKLPPTYLPVDQLEALVTLYAEGLDYRRVFPHVDPFALHCTIHQYLLLYTAEKHKRAELQRNFEFSDFKPDAGRRLLVFEYETGFAIRASQVQQIRDLLYAPTDRPRIQQIMMGGGKTSVLSPMLLSSVIGDGLGAFMSPPAVFNQNAHDLTTKTESAFGQQGFVLSCERSTGQQKLQTLRWVKAQLEEALLLRRYVLLNPKTLLCFQNLLVMNMPAPQEYMTIMDILNILRTKAMAVIDEIDTIFDPNTEVNFPLNHTDTEKDMPVMGVLTMVFHLSSFPGENESLKEQTYQTQIKPALVKELMNLIENGHIPFMLKSMHPQSMKVLFQDMLSCSLHFFTNPLADTVFRDVSGRSCSENRNMRIVHMFLDSTLPQVVRFRRNVDYGLSHVNTDQAFVIPYSFANKPVEGSKFSNYMLAVGLSFQYWFQGGLTAEMFTNLMRDLRQLNSRNGKGLLSQVNEYLHLDFPGLAELPTELLEEDGEAMIPSRILRDTNLISGCLGRFVLPKIRVSASQVTNFALNLDSSISNFIGFSGTIGCSHIFPSRAQVIEDDTVESRLRERTLEQPLTGAPRVYNTNTSCDKDCILSQLVLDNTLDFPWQTNALLDCGAFLRDFRNIDVARFILAKRSDIHVVMYYHDQENKIVALHRSKKRFSGATKDVMKRWNVTYEEVFLYLDQQHTVGTDVRLGPTAVAVLTVARKTNLEELMQAIMRMRNYEGLQTKDGKKQDVVFMIQGEARTSLKDVWLHAHNNTKKLQVSTEHTVHWRKAIALYRRFYFEKQPDAARKLSRDFTSLAFQRNKDYLMPEDAQVISQLFASVDNVVPFELEIHEKRKLTEAVSAAVRTSGDVSAFVPETEMEMEMELEQEAEMQVERLRNDEDLNENSYTNDPVQWAPLYALCSENNAAKSWGSAYPVNVHACASVSGWLRGSNRTDGMTEESVAATYSFTIARPSPSRSRDFVQAKEFHHELEATKNTSIASYEELLRRHMNFFEDPWILPHIDEAQPADLSKAGQYLLSDFRKNVRNVAFIFDEKDASHFQFVLVTAGEARELDHFCNGDRKKIEVPKRWEDFFWNSDLLNRVRNTDTCEDVQRLKIRIEHRMDIWQQHAFVDGGSSLSKFLKDFWATHACKVLTPTALPEDYLTALLPTTTLQAADAGTRQRIKTALVEVLALAGAVEAFETSAFKNEYISRMQEAPFREAYLKVRELAGQPMDPFDLDIILHKDHGSQQAIRLGQ